MISMGLNLSKGFLHYTVLEGSKSVPTFCDKGRLAFNVDQPSPIMADWFDKNFRELFIKYKPDRIGYRVSNSTNKDVQLQYLIFPWGVLNLISNSLGIETVFLTTNKFTHRKFGVQKPFNRMIFIDQKVGSHPPNWNDAQRLSALASLACLDD